MSIKTKVIIVLSALVFINFIIGIFVLWENGQTSNILKTQPAKVIAYIDNANTLDILSQNIQYYDEVLTQSARNYAFTGDVKWKKRYNDNAPILDATIKEAILKGAVDDKKFFLNIDNANKALVAMEENSIQLVDLGKRTQAQTILDSTAYSEQKAVYKAGIDSYQVEKTKDSKDAVAQSLAKLNNINQKVLDKNTITGFIIGSIMVLVALSALVTYFVINYLFIRPINSLKKSTDKIAKGDLDQKVEVTASDEIGDLARSFNIMAADLQASKKNIDEKIASRTSELELTNKAMIGRELKMIELKKKIAELENLKGAKDENKK